MTRIKVLILTLVACASIGLHATDWAQVRLSVSHMRAEGKEQAEIVSQALMGTPVKVLQKNDNGWWEVETPDGYHGWMDCLSLEPKTEQELNEWRSASRLVMTNPYQIECYNSPTSTGVRDAVTDLVNGDIVEGRIGDQQDGRVQITLPDGRTCWAAADCFTPINEWASQDFSADKILDQAHACMGVPYMWGGLSTKAIDCSGLVRNAYWANGRLLMRDASQQIHTGKSLDPTDFSSFQPADLLFFGDKETVKIKHVALYDKDNHIIHSSGRVRVNSIIPGDDDYYDREIIGATRIAGCDGMMGITPVCDHTWYFNQ